MPQLHRVLQGVWRLSRDRWRSVRKGRCIEWKAAIGCRKELTQTALESLSANAFLKCHDDWAKLEDDVFSKILEAEKDATTSFFAQAKGSDRSESIPNLQAEAVNMLPTEEVIPEAQDDFMYFQRPTVDGYIQFGRYPKNHPEAEEVILDTSTLAEGTGLADVIACKVSDDHKLLAYVVDLTGDDSFELHVRPVASSNAETVRIPGIRSVEFLGRVGNSIDLLAVRIDATTKRAKQVLHLRLTGSRITEHLMWEEQNPAAYLELFRTKNRKFVLASSNTKDTSAVRFVKCEAHMDLTKLLEPIPGVEYFAEHREGDFFVISNHERSDFSVYLLPESKAGSNNWSQLKHFFTPPGEMHVTDADLLSSWLILYGHEAAAPRICVVPIAEPQSAYLVDLPRIGSVEPGVNADHDADQIRFTFRSPVEPGCIYNLDLSNRILSLEGKRTGGFTSEIIQSVECDRFDCAARDGERIPVTLLRPRELQPGPCLLHVYGAYGTCMTPDFRPEHLMLLRRGWLLAWAHVRGGGERGWAWHQAGRQLQKSRSVLDLADVVRFLLSRDMVAPGALCLKASSAGAITLGSFLNCGENAALVGAAILEVPFLDVLNSMSDPMLPLTAHEFAEWGDPRDPEHEFNIRSLCPYENIRSHSYPHIYLSCALADARAPAWMTVKYAARMRARTPGYMSNTGHGLS